MSRGTRITPIRIGDDLLAEIDAALASANTRRADEPYDRSSWIRSAIREKLQKLKRAKRSKEKGKAGPESQ